MNTIKFRFVLILLFLMFLSLESPTTFDEEFLYGRNKLLSCELDNFTFNVNFSHFTLNQKKNKNKNRTLLQFLTKNEKLFF